MTRISISARAQARDGGPPTVPIPAASQPDHAEVVCPKYHEAVEFIGKRWTGAIVQALLGGPLRFSEIAVAVPELSDRLLSERMKELEARGVVARRVLSGPPVKVEYELTPMGRELEPALSALKAWARRWIAEAHPTA